MLAWLLLVVLVVAALVAYLNGISEEKPWGRPVLILCSVGLFFVMISLMYPVLLVVLTAVAVVGYIKGVRQDVDWAKWMVSLCLVGIIVVILFKTVPTRRRTVAARATALDMYAQEQATEASRAALLATAFKEQLPPGGRLLVLGGGHLEGWVRPAWDTALSQVLGEDWEMVGFYGPLAGGAAAISEALAERGPVDAVISYIGLPPDWAEVSIHEFPEPPKVAAYFPAKATDLELVRKWLKEGHVHAALVRTEDGLELYTKERLP